jgi:hypothetical protein
VLGDIAVLPVVAAVVGVGREETESFASRVGNPLLPVTTAAAAVAGGFVLLHVAVAAVLPIF